MAVSPDPMLAALQGELSGITLGDPASADGKLEGILDNPNLFGVSLTEAGLKQKVVDDFKALIAGPGAVRETLKKVLC